jgi:hypothetical protein
MKQLKRGIRVSDAGASNNTAESHGPPARKRKSSRKRQFKCEKTAKAFNNTNIS